MTKTLYLHLGMPKCASTTIQGVLSTHAALFAQHGKFYGMPPGDTTREQGNVSVLLSDLRNKRKSKIDRALKFFFERDSDVILSSEMFIGLARNPLSDELVAHVRKQGFEVQLICYLRRQDLWIESDYKQHIKGGSDWNEGLEALLAQRTKTKVLNYHWMLENWTRSVPRGNITVVPLHSGQDELYPVERFLSFLGMDPALAADMAMARQNVSPPVGLIEPLRCLKAALLAQGVKPARLEQPLNHFLQEAPTRISVPARKFLLPFKRRMALLETYAASNADLSRDYLDGVPAFDDTVEEEAQPLAPLAEEAAAVLAAWIVSEPAQQAGAGGHAVLSEPGLRARWWPWHRD